MNVAIGLAGAMAVGLLPSGALPSAWAGQQPPAAVGKPSVGKSSSAGDSADTEAEALARAERTGQNVEVLSLRGESSDVFATPEGDLEAREYLRPVRTRIDGVWQPIDTALAEVGSGAAKGMVAPKAAAVGLAFSGGGSGPLVRLERAGRTLELSWPDPVPAPRLDGDTATYPDILPDVDLQLAARSEGFTQLLVVKSAQAAQSEKLAPLRLALGTEGLVTRETTNGGLEAVDEGAGGVVFEAPRPVMWDSSEASQESAGQPAQGAKAAPAAKTVTGRPASPIAAGTATAASGSPTADADANPEPTAADAARVEPVGVDIAPGGDELVLTPHHDLLTGPDTVYPVFIDPQWDTPKATSWTVASRYWHGSPQWKFNGDSDAGLGYCGWSYCQPYDVKRLFYQFPISKYAGRSILSAEFVVRETHAASCDPREVQLWRTKGINSSTTWDSQDAAGFWIDHIQSRSFAYGYDGCASADAEFDVKDTMSLAAAKKWSQLTFGMRASSLGEDDRYSWKRFSDDAFLRIRYNRPPPRISTSQLSMDPGGSCAKSGSEVRVRSRATIKAINVTDPDKDRLQVQFRALWDTGDGWKQHWISAKSTHKASGSPFSIQLPTSIPQNKVVGWQARAWDGGQWSPWSVENAHSCHFVYDTTVPVGPEISSTQYPHNNDDDPNDPWWDGVGRYGTFTIDSTSSDVTKYWFGVNEDPSSKHTLTTSGGGAKTMKFMPTKAGINFITAKAFDAAGNGSESRTYYFRVRAGQPDRLSWQMDEGAGASQVTGSGGAWSAPMYSGLKTGAEGVSGNGIELDGVDDYAASDSPVLNTAKSFTVSVWAKLPASPTGAPVAVAQAGSSTSGYEIYYSTGLGGWVFLRHATDVSGSGVVRAVQPACPNGDTACQASRVGTWTHLVGVFDYPEQALKLYVDGKVVATAPFTTTPWDARGRTLLGAASHYGTVEGFFKGSLDEAQFFDYQLTDAQVTRLHDRLPVDTNRPAKLVFPLDGTATDVVLTGHAQEAPAQLKGGAVTGTAGVNGRAVEFDGIDDYATTGRPIMDTAQSFALSAWVKLPKDKEARGMTLVSQGTGDNRGFEIYHSTALGGWVFLRHTSDEPAASVVRATQQACPANTNCSAARLGEWNHVAGVYDRDTSEMRLYVNSVLEATASFTTPWLAVGEVTLGGTWNGSKLGNTLKGAMDDVRLYDRAVSDDEVRQLFKQRPLVKSRWKFETASTANPPVTPDSGPAGAGLSLYNDAKLDSGWVDGGLALNGVNQYAATASGVMPVDTGASFTVSVFAQTAAVPTSQVALLSAPGSSKDAFSVRYVPSDTPDTDGGRWRITTTEADKADAASAQVDNGQFYGPTEWTHLAMVYDGFAHELRLYVNGELETVACQDADEDGAPDVGGCTDKVSYADDVVTFKSVQSLQLGRDRSGAYFPGSVSDLWTFQGALSESQIGHLAVGQPGTDTTVPGTY
ncbi:LamG domain-containing protein [Streptomyces bluensis]|uniref:LamG domain-containing protein n=1 Tax=Streptomyces bluensis TaxID=33897 RepID=UPI0036896ECC